MASQPRSTSSLPIVSAATTNVSSQIPVFSKKSDNPSNPGKKATFVSESAPSTKMTTSVPILVSNNEILSMFQQVQQQMLDQQKMNQRLLREMETLRAEKNKLKQTSTPLAPRILDFGTSGISGNHSGDFIPMQSSFGDPSGSQGLRISRDNTNILRTSCLTPITSNTFNHSPIDTANFGSVQESGLTPQVAKEIQKLRDMISIVPGVVKPIPEVPVTTHRISRFAPPICDAEIPKRFQTPTMKLYDGTTDPEEHVAQYRERMETNLIPPHLKEACLFKGFGSTLTGAALKWLLNVPPYSITSFAHLINLFNSQFSCSRTFERLTSDLYRVTQGPDESLRNYVNKFGRESLDIPNLDITTAVQAFKMGLQRDSPFYDDLVMNPCRNMDEVQNRALRFIRLEDDKEIQKRITTTPPNDQGKRKLDSPTNKSFKSKPYYKADNHKINSVDEDEDDEEYPRISEYCFSVDFTELMCAMQDLGEKARWPPKEKKFATRDKSKWCAFHEDFGHITDDCIALRKEISYLLRKGHLKELLGKKKERRQDSNGFPKRAASPPKDAKVINFISGGSDICGTSYSAARKHAKEAKMEYGERPTKTSTLTTETVVSFEEQDRENILDPHHDGLVITLYVDNHYVRRILIDGGSSVNIIQLETLKRMNIPESEITTKSLILPWIHDMKAVTLTYHQCVKLPTPWGVVKINSDQQEAKEEMEVKEVPLNPDDLEVKVLIGTNIPQDIEEKLISFLKSRVSTFAWKHEDMTGISSDVITHKLGIDRNIKPVHQKRRKFAPERNLIIQEEVEKLLKAKMIREVKFPKWLANVVVVQKKNGRCRVCVDYTDLNKACHKDPFPLPHIDSMVDATAGHEILTFMDASAGFQQIQMEPSNQEDTAFMTPTGIYCYTAMPFGLKNAGATYQRLITENHLRDLQESFDILDRYNMKLNPSKCHFGVRSGKFLGYMVTKRGIEASSEQIQAILNLKSPKNIKEVQRLTGRIAALNRFISRSSKKFKGFYDILKKNKKFHWDEEHEKALQHLKEYLSSPSLLMRPEDGEPLSLYLAVSRTTVSAVLVKDHQGSQHPVYYVSKSLVDAETRYSHLEKLILALVMASTKLRHYFETHRIHIKTNYPIKSVLRKPELSGRMAKWSVKLSTYDLIYEPRTTIKSQALADFVADFSSDLQPEVDLEIKLLDEDTGEWTLFTDGSSNVRGTGLGIILKSPQGDIIPQSISCEFQATNNEAEYEALIAGLQLARDMNIRNLHVFVDSLLIANQFNGSYMTKGDKLAKYLEIVKDISGYFFKFDITQVPRDENAEADALANLASSLRIPEDINIPILHILRPAIDMHDIGQDSEPENTEVHHSEAHEISWTIPIKNYLQTGKIPDEETNPRTFKVKVSRYTIIRDILYRKSISGPYLRTGYFWRTMRRDAMSYSQKCDACQRHSNILHQPAETLHPIVSSWPFMKWGMDIVGKLPKAPGGKVFMLAMTDYFSKWIEAEPFVQVREKEVISFIKRNILTRFGIPAEITCDNGSQFIGKRTTNFCESWGIKMITSTPVHPQANGQAESSNKIIINNLKKKLGSKKGKWAEELPFVLWADRTTTKNATGQTPFSLVYGFEAVLPTEMVVPTTRSSLQNLESNKEILSEDLDTIDELRDIARIRMATYQQKIAKSYNKNIMIRIFQVGDLVLSKAFQNTTNPADGKLVPKWEGPYKIESEAGKGAYKLINMEGEPLPRSWNAIHLKLYFI
ncbi:hypothetical protein E3N88_23479 [Mikania micrantha]|uniref:Uncharacterized protein n=1 Tax=Mikania micrantha TaxID=192012 RepID=A0A5N6NG24_9ASTR|nr:hypothetical protein E3N88_23479 [Mikania micrantha]